MKRRSYDVLWTGEVALTCDQCGGKWLETLTLCLLKEPKLRPQRKGRCDRCIALFACPTLLKAFEDANGGKL